MAYTILAGLFIFVALFIAVLAGRLLFKGSWVLGWIKGMVGLALLSLAVILGLSAFDVYSYKQVDKEETIATISFTKTDSQQYQVSLVDKSGVESIYQLTGDLWQLDARIIKWNKSLSKLGLSAGYRLDRLSGRYYALEKEKTAERSVYDLANSKSTIDVWKWYRDFGQGFSIIDASYGSATYVPMEDGALFSVNLTNSGLISRPLNDRAKAIVTAWQ